MNFSIKLFTTFILLLVFTNCKSQTPNFQGKWTDITTNDTTLNHFILRLNQAGTQLTGSHCSIQEDGGKIDCDPDTTKSSILGVINGDSTVTVTFKNFYSFTEGKGTIRMIDVNTIEWKITTWPTGVCFLTEVAIMKKN